MLQTKLHQCQEENKISSVLKTSWLRSRAGSEVEQSSSMKVLFNALSQNHPNLVSMILCCSSNLEIDSDAYI